MNCIQKLSGIGLACDTNVGGLIEVYIANKGDVASVALDETSNKIKTITMTDTAKFKKYSFRRGSSSFTSTLNVDDTNGINYVQTDLALVFAKMDTPKRIEIAALSLGELVVIVKDCNGLYWYMGYNEAVQASAGGAQSGTARGDANNYTITLTDYSPSYLYEVDPAALTDVIES